MIRVLALFATGMLAATVTTFGAVGKKISDYTETLTIGDAWMYEIAVPGVTNYKVAFGTMATNIAARVNSTNLIINGSGNLSFNTTNDTLQLLDTNGAYTGYIKLNGQSLIQFSNTTKLGFGVAGNTNWYINNDGPGDLGHYRPTLSNTYSFGSVTQGVKKLWVNDVSLLGVTKARPLFLDASGNITNVTGTPNGAQFVRDDGVLAVPPGSGGEVTTAQLNTASNTLSARIVSNDTTTSNGLVNLMSSSGSTQVVVAAFGNVTVTNTLTANTLSVVTFHANSMTLTNPMGSNQVRMGYQDLTNVLRRQTFFAPAGYMISNTTDGATFVTEQGAPPTNRMSDRYVFSGAITNVVEFETVMPENWDLSTVKVKLWTTSTNNVGTTTNVWGISASALKHGSTITNINWGTEVLITNVVSGAGGQSLVTPATPALTVGNSPAAAGNLVGFRIRRLPGHPDDNDDGQQKLLGAWVKYGETMAEVAAW